MAQTLAQINKQIEKLQKEADALRQAETKGVIARIKVAISHYGLTADQLGFEKSAAKVARAKNAGAKPKGAPRFSNGDGQVWVGRGPRPLWLREALARGRSLDEFDNTRPRAVQKASVSSAPAVENAAAAAPADSSVIATKRTKRAAKASGKVARSKSPTVPAAVPTSESAPRPKAKRVARKGATPSVASQSSKSEKSGVAAPTAV